MAYLMGVTELLSPRPADEVAAPRQRPAEDGLAAGGGGTAAESPAAEPVAGERRRSRNAKARRVAAWLVRGLLIAGVLWLLGYYTNADSMTPFVQLIAYTPYVGAMMLALCVLSLVLALWRESFVAMIVALAFVAMLLPRMISDAGPASATIPLRVASVNIFFAEADVEQIVELVTDERVDVLSVQEVDADDAEELTTALDGLLPFHVLRARDGHNGTALFARYPLRDGRTLHRHSTFDQAHARMTVTTDQGTAEVDVIAAHPSPPVPGSVDDFDADYGYLPNAPQRGPVQLLAGDFNATLDHTNLRDLIATGYRDAGAATGKGLIGTWPAKRSIPIPTPPVTIDHILVDERAAVRKYSVRPIDGSDHHAIVAELRLPKSA